MLRFQRTTEVVSTSRGYAWRMLWPLVALAWFGLLVTQWLGFLGGEYGEALTPQELKGLLPFEVCWIHYAFGLPCLFCGLTRSFVLIGRGEWLESFHYHVLGIPIYGLTLYTALMGLVSPASVLRTLHVLGRAPGLYWLLAVFSIGWLWKLGHSSLFW